jgi:hypothetical protein
MCIICVDFDKGRMTSAEARRALGEMVVKLDPQHVAEVERTLRDADTAASSARATPSGQGTKKQP